MEEKTMFEKMYAINVNEYTEKKNGLTYLSWSYAWAEFKKVYPNATYEIRKFENGMPFIFDKNTGYMVFTRVTADNLTYEMWLPVMDSANKAMKDVPYTYDTKYKKGLVCEAATMFDINKTIMRCLVKNLAMFGLGLYVYSGEDLPEEEKNAPEPKIGQTTIDLIVELITKYAKMKDGNPDELLLYYLKKYNAAELTNLTETQGLIIGKELSNLIQRNGEKQ